MLRGEPRSLFFPARFDRLAAEMRGRHVLSFTRPAGIRTGAWRSIRVVVDRRDANVRTIQDIGRISCQLSVVSDL